jgi:anti-anti-sigma factor
MTNKVVEINPPKSGTGARTILTFKDPLTYQNHKELEAMVYKAISQHKMEVILDCKAVSFIDSVGLEMLIEIDQKLRTRGGVLKIIGLNELCKDILVATRLIGNFHVYEDIHVAIRSGP